MKSLNKEEGKSSSSMLSRCDALVFDFDSTVIKTESLEIMLAEVLAESPTKEAQMAEIDRITRACMDGHITFTESLSKRLAIAKPTRTHINNFVKNHLPSGITAGMEDLFRDLKQMGKKVFILSGGFTDLILPFARHLDVPDSRVHAVNIEWEKEEPGTFVKILPGNRMADAKVEGAKLIPELMECNFTIGIGDGYSDYVLYRDGCVHRFFGFTEHAEREKVVQDSPHTAASVTELRQKISTLE